MTKRRKLSKMALLDYALEGATTQRGVYAGHMDEDEENELNADIAEICRRIKLVMAAEQRRQANASKVKP